MYINGKPPGSPELSNISHDLIIIGVLSYKTNRQKGIIKNTVPNTSIYFFALASSLFEKTSILT